MRRVILSCLAIAFAIACGDTVTEPVPDRTPTGTPEVAFATSTSEDGRSITTDKDDYSPGDTVRFTGAGWTPGDVLDIVLTDEPTNHRHEWKVNIREDGTFRDSTYVVDNEDLGVTFTLTATSQTDPAQSLAVTFTDGNVRFVTSPANVVSTITYSRWNSSGACPANVTPNQTNQTLNYDTGLGLNDNQSLQFTIPSVSGFTYAGYTGGGISISPTSSPSNTILCISGFAAGDQRVFTLNYTAVPAGPTKLAFITSAFTGTVGQCLGPITVETQNASDAATNVTSNTTVNLATNAAATSGAGTFYSDNACATSATSITINSGGGSGSFYYKATARGSTGAHQLTASATGLTSASQTQTINPLAASKLAFTTTAFTGTIGQCLGAITVETQNASDVTTNVSTNTTVNLATNAAATSGAGAFYSDNACATSATSITINSGSSSGSFYYKATTRGTTGAHQLTASATNFTSANQTQTINKADQTISFTSTAPANAVYGQTYAVSATATSGLTVSFSSLTAGVCTVSGSVSFVGVGTCTIAADQAGNGDYNAAPQVTQTFQISKAPATITLSNLSQVYDGSPKPATATTSPVVGLMVVTITYDGSATAPTDAGSYAVLASLDNPFYEATTASGTLVIDKAPQTITFTSTAPTGAVMGGSYTVSATASSGLAVTFSSLAPTVCTVSGSTVNFVGVGNCTVAADQAGNNNYQAAPQKTQSFNIRYVFSGFSAPVDWPTIVNMAKAGQAIPLKWQLTDAVGNPITTLTAVKVSVKDLACIAANTDQVEEYSSGDVGLQNLGGGYYQFNWKTPGSYASSCKSIGLDLGEGAVRLDLARFTFKR